MKHFLLGFFAAVLVIVMCAFAAFALVRTGVIGFFLYTSSPGLTSVEAANEFYATMPRCMGVSLPARRLLRIPDSPSQSICIGTLVENGRSAQTYTPSQTAQTQPGGADSAWQTYQSRYGFEVKYPQDWKVIHELDSGSNVSFGTGTYGNEGYDGEWFLSVHDKSSANVEGLVANMGKQFADRQEKRENLTINGLSALQVTITTPSVPGWVYEAVLIESENRIYFMHNGAVESDSFTDFYNSFKLI